MNKKIPIMSHFHVQETPEDAKRVININLKGSFKVFKIYKRGYTIFTKEREEKIDILENPY